MNKHFIYIIILVLVFLPGLTSAEVNNITVDLQNPHGEGYNIDEYENENIFARNGLYGIYYGSYFKPFMYKPSITFENEVKYNMIVNLSSEIVASGVSEFYVLSPFYQDYTEYMEYNDHKINPEFMIESRNVYHIRGIFPADNYEFSFVTSQTNHVLFITYEDIGNFTMSIDDIDYNISFKPDIDFLFVSGAHKEYSYVKIDLKPEESIEFYSMLPVLLNNTYYQIYLPCLSEHTYRYYASFTTGSYSIFKEGYSNHQVVINYTSSTEVYNRQIYIRIKNYHDYNITIYLLLQKGFTHLYGSDYDLFGKVTIFTKSFSSSNTYYNDLWKTYDLDNYYTNNTLEFKEFFGWVHAIIDVNREIEVSGPANKLKTNILTSILDYINGTITGNIKLFSDSIFNELSTLGSFISTEFIMLQTIIKSLVNNIINIFEVLIDLFLPAVLMLIVLKSLYVGLNVIYEIKKVKL